MSERERRVITVGELKQYLASYPDDWQITFGGVLDFNRLKKRGDKLVDMEFQQSVYRDASGKLHADDLD